ncbi:MAG: helix-turn-helix domain-containing protein [Cohaesibacter sp.]|jgi:excisionase family DNA binding protein|nr:helix-turn-helix domain-containing protein [Cohaesibacter sp.]
MKYQLLTVDQTAEYMGVNKKTLQRMRCDGTGPAFIKASERRILYSEEAIYEYLEKNTYRGTSEYKN